MRQIAVLAVAGGIALASLVPSAPAEAAHTCPGKGFEYREAMTSQELAADRNGNSDVCVQKNTGKIRDDNPNAPRPARPKGHTPT